jgi:hypothetical protein
MILRPVLLAAIVLIAVGCRDAPESAPAVPAAAGSKTAAAASPSGICPLTLPNGRTPDRGNDAGMNHGNGKLWTAFWPYNLVIADADYVEADGSVRMKWPWWRGIAGQVRITGRRLDGPAPRLTADVGTGYGRRGFQPSTILFPAEGCWEVTARVGSSELAFVTFVVKASTYSLEQSR